MVLPALALTVYPLVQMATCLPTLVLSRILLSAGGYIADSSGIGSKENIFLDL